MKEYRQLFPDIEEGLWHECETKGKVVRAEPGAILIKSGQYIRSTVLVLEGTMKLYREDDEGSEFFMYHLLPGDGCALSMICDRTFKTSVITAKAESAVVLMIIPIEETENWMRQYRTWYHFVVDSYRRRYEELLLTIDHVAFRNMDERLEFYLRRHTQTHGTNILKMTHTEIAQELNSSREVISRLIKKLSEQGKIRVIKQGIEVL